jgi:L-amino acid N-acyltransferase YncA
MAVKIRPVALKDAANFRRCYAAIAKEGQYIFPPKTPSLAFLRADLRNLLRTKTTFLVAVDGQQIVGWVIVGRPGTPSLSHCGDVKLFLLLRYKGTGVDAELVTRALKMSRGKFESLLFYCFRKDEHARKLGAKLGFMLRGHESKFAKLAYGFDDLLIMQRHLSR